MTFETHVDNLPFAHGGYAGSGLLRGQNSHFKVSEQLSFEPSGEGEHIFLLIEKDGLNTDDVVKILSKYAEVPRRSISFAGMKDRHAITQQWFSVQMPGKEGPDWEQLNDQSIQIKQVTRHIKKLKRGAIKFNYFEIVISHLEADEDLIQARADQIVQRGVPNYFMEQRFGYLGNNLTRVNKLFSRNEPIKNRKLKGLLLSSARSYLFNSVLSARVADKSWDKAVAGDAFILDGSRQFFKGEAISDDITDRLLRHDIHPSGPMFGIGDSIVSSDVKDMERVIFDDNTVFCDGLIKEKLESARRPLRVIPHEFNIKYLQNGCLNMSFKLQSGSYATAVIREILRVSNKPHNKVEG